MFTLKIETDNAAFAGQDQSTDSEEERCFEKNAEVARILRVAANNIEKLGYNSGRLFDSNGSGVGEFSF